MTKQENSISNDSDAALKFTWGKYREYAATSRSTKAQLTKWRYRVLILGIAGAVLGVLCQETIHIGLDKSEWSWIPTALGVLSALSLGLAAYFGKELVNPEQERGWIRSRSMAEALKSQAYLYVTNTAPYHQSNNDKLLVTETKRLLEKVNDLQYETLAPEQKLDKILPNSMTVNQYLINRVSDQINNYYFPTAAKYIEKMKKNRKIGLVLGIIAVILGALGFTGWTAGWVAVISTITASIATYIYANRFQYLIISYQATGNRLEVLKTEWETANLTDGDFIKKCEEAISIENSAWMAEFVKKGSKSN